MTAQSPLSIVLTGQTLSLCDLRERSSAALDAIRPALKGDVVFTNFEVAIADEEEARNAPKKGLGPGEQLDAKRSLYAPPAMLDVCTELGFNLLAFANNHIYDLGEIGLVNALNEVRARGIANAGIGMNSAEAAAPGYLDTAKGRVAMVAMSSGHMQPDANAGENRPGVNVIDMDGRSTSSSGTPRAEDRERNLASIREARANADLVIAYHHNHVYNMDFIMMMREQQPQRLVPAEWIKAWAHDMVDAGADMVVFHGTPLLKGIEVYKGKPIFYGLGNFIFNLPLFVDFFEPIVFTSVIPTVEFDGRTLKSITLRPIALNALGEGEGVTAVHTRGLPALATGDRAGYILQRIVDASKPFGLEFEIDGEVARAKLGATATSAQPQLQPA
jgi:poly-gamma-glutamate synthesis protein (capsule biosynthesis protein)